MFRRAGYVKEYKLIQSFQICERNFTVVNKPNVRLGHPEASLGVMPGSGGVIRLMWLLGVERAFPILANGQSYNPEEALKAGIIDELASDQADMIEKTNFWLLQNQEGRRPWDTEGGKIPGGTARDLKIWHTGKKKRKICF